MNILLTAATQGEIQPTIDFIQKKWVKINENNYTKRAKSIEILVSGIGSLSAAYSLTRYFSTHDCQLAIQAGIAGSFRKEIALGQVLAIENDRPGDWGVENNEHFEDLFDTGLLHENDFPFRGRIMHNDLRYLPASPLLRKANGVTVNTVSGSGQTIRRLEDKYHPDVETMEGAAFHYVCLREGIPFLQLRSISNHVEIRDKSKWNIPLAIRNLNKYLVAWLES